MRLTAFLIAGAGVLMMAAAPRAARQTLPTFTYRIVNTYPHDARAFTQGLIYVDGALFESVGDPDNNGQSALRKVKLETGEVLQRFAVGPGHFAEGLTDWKSQLVQITWQTHTAFVYERATFALVKKFTYDGDGWGLTHDATHLILSDGGPEGVLKLIDPATFAVTGRIVVTDQGKPVRDLNELEFVKGEIFANVWHTNRIARIAPASGKVTGWIDLAGLLKPGEVTSSEAVLNGIAYDAAGDRLFVTGKLWPKLFEIKVEPRR